MLMGRTILIFGFHPLSRAWAEDQPGDVEIWVANEANLCFSGPVARIFQLHPRDWREKERRWMFGRLPKALNRQCFGRNRAHVDWLRGCGVPVYSQRVWPDIPTCVRYPFEAVTDAVGIPMPPSGAKKLYATNSFGYMMALALLEHLEGHMIDEIRFAGVELTSGSLRERIWEMPNLAYYMGLAQGWGIRLAFAPTGTTLLNAPPYALGYPNFASPDFWGQADRPLSFQLDENTGFYEVIVAPFARLYP